MTETVLLAGLRMADFKDLRRLLARGQIDYPYFYEMGPNEAAFKFAAFALLQNHRRLGPVMNGIYSEDEQRLMGAVVLLPELRNKNVAEIGYFLHPVHQGRGIASAAARFVVKEAAESWLSELKATVHPDNFKSRKILERLGMVLVREEPISRYLERDGRRYAPRCHYWAAGELIASALKQQPQRGLGQKSLPKVERADARFG